jgi:hypothetical protein
MAAALDLGSFTFAEKTSLLAAAKAELLRRAGVGAVQTGASTGQSFSMTKYTEDGLIALINSLTVDLGFEQPIIQAKPNFAARC